MEDALHCSFNTQLRILICFHGSKVCVCHSNINLVFYQLFNLYKNCNIHMDKSIRDISTLLYCTCIHNFECHHEIKCNLLFICYKIVLLLMSCSFYCSNIHHSLMTWITLYFPLHIYVCLRFIIVHLLPHNYLPYNNECIAHFLLGHPLHSKKLNIIEWQVGGTDWHIFSFSYNKNI